MNVTLDSYLTPTDTFLVTLYNNLYSNDPHTTEELYNSLKSKTETI